MTSSNKPILIIGAGVSGLTLAQACRKQGLPYRIFERDSSPEDRGVGWGLTIHWALPTFKDLLPDDIGERVPEAYVNRDAVEAGDKGTFTFFDLSTGEAKWKVPAAERIRVSRARLRTVLLSGVEVQWSKTLSDIEVAEHGVKAIFDDSTSETGSILIGCDGANSIVRRMLDPSDHHNTQLPVRFIGAGVWYEEASVSAIRKLDSYFLQGSDPRTDAYFWFSFLDTPSDGAPEGKYRCQVMTSWPYRPGWLDRADPTEMPNTKTGQMSLMRHLAEHWAEPFRSIVHNMPRDAEIRPVELADWLPRRSEGFDGRLTLLGDAAHTMVMYRGEGANHAIIDVDKLLHSIKPLYGELAEQLSKGGFEAARQAYELEMIERTEMAVLASRRACLDAHEWKRLNDHSPLLRRRVMRADLDLK